MNGPTCTRPLGTGEELPELGQTRDPTALVPGSSASVYELATSWRTRSSKAEHVASQLRTLAPPDGWDGEASVGFATRLAAAAATWDEAASHLLLLANLTENYAGVLEWAQGEAARAIDLWEKGELDSARGLAEYRSLLTRARPTEILPYYRDTGEPARSEATAVLEGARKELRTAGDVAASKLESLEPPELSPWAVPRVFASIWGELLIGSTVDVAVGSINGVASALNSMIRNPDALLALLGGVGLVAGGGAMMGTGGAASLTGVGATVGAPAIAGGLAVAGSGLALAGAGAAQITTDAIGDGRVQMVQPRDQRGRFAQGDGSSPPGKSAEQRGLDEYADQNDVTVVRDQVAAKVDGGNPNGRKYDGLVDNGDGTWTAIEVKSGGASKTADQRLFDDIVNSGTPATARLNGEQIKITDVVDVRMPTEVP